MPVVSFACLQDTRFPRVPDVPVDPRKRVPRHRGRRMDSYEGFPARGTFGSTPNAHAVAPSGPKCPSRSRIYDGDSLRRFLHTQTGEAHVDAYLTWTLSPGGADPAAVSCLDVFFQHSDSFGVDAGTCSRDVAHRASSSGARRPSPRSVSRLWPIGREDPARAPLSCPAVQLSAAGAPPS